MKTIKVIDNKITGNVITHKKQSNGVILVEVSSKRYNSYEYINNLINN